MEQYQLVKKIREYIKRSLNPEYIALFACVFILDFVYRSNYLKGARFYEATWRLWLYCIIMWQLYLLFKSKLAAGFTDFFKNLIKLKPLVFTISLSLPLFYLLSYFPPGKWGSSIVLDDYPIVLEMSRRGLAILKQGGYFGWDSSFAGGYFTAADIGLNLVHLLLPVSFLGWETALHFLLLVAVLGFPVLCFYYVKSCLHVNSDKALVILPIAAFFVLQYFRGFLFYGMVAAFLGIDLAILSLIAFERLRQERPYSFFLLTFILAVLFYTHPGMFVCSLAYIFVDFILSPDRKILNYLFYLGGLLLVILSPFLIYKIRYPGYLIADNYYYEPSVFSLRGYLGQIIERAGIILNFTQWRLRPARYHLLFFLPVIIYLLGKKAWKKIVVFIAVIFIFYVFIPKELFLFSSRMAALAPFLLSVLLSGFLIENYEKRHFAFLSLGLLLSLGYFYPAVLKQSYSFPHAKAGNFYNRPLVEKIRTLGGRYIAVENNQHWTHLGRQVIPKFHWLPLLQPETKKLFFSEFQDGYSHTPYRANTLVGGYFRGRPINQWAVEDLNSVLSQWGIEYLAVWNKKTKAYFSGRQEFFEKIWEDADWIIFKFKNSDLRSAVVEGKGRAEVIDRDFFEKQILLFDCEKGSRVAIRSNYFPAWKAYYNRKEIQLIDVKGQAGFFAPASGSYSVIMKYPRDALLNILAISALMLSGFLSYKRILP